MKNAKAILPNSLLILLAVLVFGCRTSPAPQTRAADLILRGARVWSGDPNVRDKNAVALKGDRILAVCRAEEVGSFIGPQTEIIDLEGGLVLPGFHDAHIHLLSGGLSRYEVDLFEARTLGEIQERVRAFALAHADQDWVVGRGWRYTAMPEGRLPTRADLDEVISDRPVYLEAYDGHTAWVNSRALALAHIAGDARPAGPSEIVSDAATGEPTGTLKESDAMRLVHRLIPTPTREKKLEALRKTMTLLNRLGTVSIQNASGDEDLLGLFQELHERHELTLRVSMVFSVNKETTDAELDHLHELAKRFTGPWLRVLGVKIFVDGVIESHTAAMLDPYTDEAPRQGEPIYTQSDLDDLVTRSDRAGLQVWIHAIGDRGVRMSLDAFEHALARNGTRDARFRIEHIEVISPEDLPRFHQLGVIASMQPIHSDPDTVGVWSRAVGPKRLDYAFAWRSLVEAGAHLCFGTDWPSSISVAPLRGIHAAVNRRTVEGSPPGGWIPSQRVRLETALSAFSREAAFACFEEGRRGTVSPGKLADLVVVSEDLFRIPPESIHTVHPVLTLVGATPVVRRSR